MFAGTYIVVWEGVDGAGKTTLMNKTFEKLLKLGVKVEKYKTPSGSSSGVFAKEYGNRPTTDPLTRMLIFLANTSDDSSQIKEIITDKKPDYFFIDRYYICSIVYGFALMAKRFKRKFQAEEFMDFLSRVEELGSEIFVKPDLVVIVGVDEDTRRRRALQKGWGHDRVYETDDELQKLVQQYYDFYAENRGDKVLKVFNQDSVVEELSNMLAEKILSVRGR